MAWYLEKRFHRSCVWAVKHLQLYFLRLIATILYRIDIALGETIDFLDILNAFQYIDRGRGP